VAVEGLRQGLASVLGTSALLDIALAGGVIESAGQPVTFDATLHKGSGDVRGELVLRDRAGARLTLALAARSAGDTVHVDLGGQGGLGPLAPWLPTALVQAPGAAPLDARARLELLPGDRATGRTSAQLGDMLAVEGSLSFGDRRLRVADLRGSGDLGLAAALAGLEGPVQGRAELADGEVTWAPERGGWPGGRATLRVLEATVPASALGVEARANDVEARLELAPGERGVAVRGELRGRRIEVAGVELAPLSTPLGVDVAADGSLSRVELAGLTAQVLGVPVRGAVTYDAVRARADARLETGAARLDPAARRLGAGWLGPSDQLRAGSVRVTATGLDPRGWSDGRIDAEVRELALRQPAGEAAVQRAQARATVGSGRATVALEAQGVRGKLPHFEGLVARLEGSADVVREGAGASLGGVRLTARDTEGREMFRADLARPSPGAAGPVRLTAQVPALERLAPLWPSVPREVTGSATVELQSADAGFATHEGRLRLEIPTAELLAGRLSLRDVSADVPLRRGKPAAAGPGGPLTVGELIGYGVVVHDLSGRARLVDDQLTLDDLRYALYSGQGRGTATVALAGDGLSARARLTGEGARIEEFVGAYGIRGGTMTGLLSYDLDVRYREGRLGADGRMWVPEGGTVTIELLDKLLGYADADPTGVVKQALGNLRAFDYKGAEATVRTASDDIRVSLSLDGRERFGIFPPRVKEINVRDMPLGFLGRQFPVQ
jgi:hypothetical protein